MSDVLIRGIPAWVHQRLQRKAEAENLSVNQLLIRVIQEDLEQEKKNIEKEKRDKETFRRMRAIRERLRQKYGRMSDSTKLIREDRESH